MLHETKGWISRECKQLQELIDDKTIRFEWIQMDETAQKNQVPSRDTSK